MKAQTAGSITLRFVAAIVSFCVTGYGLYMYSGADFHEDTVKMILFCLLPFLCLPALLLSLWPRRWTMVLHCTLAVAYFVDYSLLDWRTCASLEYCQSALATMWVTLNAGPVRGYFAAVALNLAAWLLRGKQRR